jgi:hypothetical protein
MTDRDDTNLISSALATRLGLARRDHGLEGILGDATVRVQVQVGRHLSGPHPTTHTYHTGQRFLSVQATLPFWPALDAGLRVEPIGSWEALRSAGNEGFDRRFGIEGREPGRAAELVGEQAREALDQSFVADPGPRVSDQGITWGWRTGQPWPTAEALGAAIRRLPVAWSAIVAASRQVRPAQGVEEAFVRLAGLQLPPGLELRGCPASVCGYLGSIWVSLAVARAGDGGLRARIALRLPQPLAGAPQVMREERFVWLDRLMAVVTGRPEITVGDEAFDQRFAVRSLEPDLLKETLDAGVRSAMLALDDLLQVHLQPSELVAGGPLPADKLGDALQAMTQLARALEA